MHYALVSNIVIDNYALEINGLHNKQQINTKNCFFNNINFEADITFSGNIICNGGISISNLPYLDNNIYYLTLDENNKLWIIYNNLNQLSVITDNIDGVGGVINISNNTNKIFFNGNTIANYINFIGVSQLLSNVSNFVDLKGSAICNNKCNIVGNNSIGSIMIDNNIPINAITNKTDISSISGVVNIIFSDGIINMPNNSVLNIPSTNTLNNNIILALTDANELSNLININNVTTFNSILNKSNLDIDSPNIVFNSDTIVIEKLTISSPITIDSSVKNIIFSGRIGASILSIDNCLISDIDELNLGCMRMLDDNVLLTGYGETFIFNDIVGTNVSNLLISADLPNSTAGSQLVLDSNNKLFSLAQSSKEFKKNIKPLHLSTSRFLDIFKNIENIQNFDDMINALENTELSNVIIYNEEENPNIIEERGLMAIVATQLNNIQDTLDLIEKDLLSAEEEIEKINNSNF